MTSTLAQSDICQEELETEIEQGSPAWHEWRRQGVGASEVSAIMGESEYDTPLSLWRRKTGREPEKDDNFAMTIGRENEGKARSLYEIDMSVDCPPMLFTHPELSWARCSLDGWVQSLRRVVEIKCMGREKHAMVRAGKVPETYVAQLQWQLFVTGAKVAHFVSLNPETMSDIEIVAVTPDMAYWDRMIPAVQAFWELIETDTPPPLTPDDYMDLESGSHLEAFEKWSRAKMMVLQLEDVTSELAAKLKGAKERLKEESEKLKAVRAEIQSLTVTLHPKLRCNGIKAWTVQRESGPTVQIGFEKDSQANPHTTNTGL